MGVFKRISDIISANLNDLTEQFEDPEKMLKQAVREMEGSISDVTQQTAKAMANEKTMSRELERNRSQAQQWQERAAEKDALVSAIAEAGLPAPAADSPVPPAHAVHAFLGQARCALTLLQADDLAGETVALNVPGTDRERPNWRRRVSVKAAELWEER